MLLHRCFFFFSSRRRHTRCYRDWSSDVCSSDLSSRIPHAETRTPADSEEAMCCFCGGSVRMDDAVRIWLSRAGSETRQHLCAHQEHLEAAIAPSEIDL